MTTETRTIEIVARVKELVAAPMRKVGKAITDMAKSATRQLKELSKWIFSAQGAFAVLVSGFGAFRGGQAFAGVVKATDEMGKLAAATGAGIEQMSVLQQVFGIANLEGTKFRQMLSVLSRTVGTALTDESSKAARGFSKLGLSIEELRTNDPVELFGKISGALERFATPQQKAAALVEIFPNAAEGLEVFLAVLGRGRGEFQKLLETANFFGGALTQGAYEAVARLNVAFELLSLSLGRVSRQATVAIAERLAPIIERFATFFATNGDRIGKLLGTIVVAVVNLALQVGAAFLRLTAFLTANGEKIAEALEEIPLIGGKAAAAVRAIFDTREVAPGARKLRDELADLADAERKLIDESERLRAQIGTMGANPEEFGPARLEEANRQLKRLTDERQATFQLMVERERQFAEAMRGANAPPGTFNRELERQREAAQLRSAAGEISQLSQWDSLPAPPADMSPATLSLFGAGGTEGWLQELRDAIARANEEATPKTFGEGWSDGIKRVKEQWSDFGAAGQQAANTIVNGGLDGLTDAFADIVTGQKSAKEAFKDLARTMLADIARIIARLLIMNALFGPSATPALETGGVMPGKVEGTVPLRKFANGGVVKRPTLALFGEGKASRGEAFVPLPDGRRIPVALTGGGGGGVMNITIQAMDGADVQRVLIGNRGTLRALWSQDISRMQAVRQTVKGAVQ